MSDRTWTDVLEQLARREDLDTDTASWAMRSMMSGDATPVQIAAFLLGLRAKGETTEEITGLARTMREFSLKVRVDGDVIDTCGTGGDRSGTVNVSTMAALVAAGAGARVAKHGNRAASSACGSADVLEALGVAIDISPEGVEACIEEAGIGFCFAQSFHPAMRSVGPVRRELGVRTVFNFLGPLTNPAGARRQTVGVSDEVMAPKMAAALLALGADRAMVFRGDDGLDELSTTTTSRVWSVADGVTEGSVDPSSYGLARATLAELSGGTAQENAEICRRVLEGERGAVHDAVVLNAAAALVVAGIARELAEGIEVARQSLASGKAARALELLRDTSQRARRVQAPTA